jgi:hypothetical protein
MPPWLVAWLLLLPFFPCATPQSYVWPTTTLTGQGSLLPGLANGGPAAATFNGPRGLCIARVANASSAANATLYRMDRNNHQLRAITHCLFAVPL